MCAALIGGMDRLKREYISLAKGQGVSLKVFTGQERTLKNQLGNLDMMILCTDKVSHAAKNEVMRYAKSNSIPVRIVHSAGISAIRNCLPL